MRDLMDGILSSWPSAYIASGNNELHMENINIYIVETWAPFTDMD